MELQTISTPPLVSTLETRLSKLKSHFESIKDSKDDEVLQAAYKAYQIALTDFQNQRMPLTKKFDDIKSKFTSLEKQISDCIDIVKNRRNYLAKEAFDFQKAQEAKQRLEVEAKQKAIELEAKNRIALKENVLALILEKKQLIVKALTTVTNDNYAKKLENLQNMVTDIPDMPMIEDLREELSNLWKTEMEDFKQQAINEIQFMKDMSVEDKKKYVEEFQKMIKGENTTALEIEQQKEIIEKEVKQTEVILDSIPTEEIKTPNDLKIEVTNKASYKALVAYWFEVIFPTYDKEIGTKTINSMLIDLQRHAKQTGQRLTVSGVIYNEIFNVR